VSKIADVKGEVAGMSYEACNVVGTIGISGTNGIWKRSKPELVFLYGLTVNGGGGGSGVEQDENSMSSIKSVIWRDMSRYK
jgi:hypothetical protein